MTRVQVFLRELISNAADACEKRRYLVRTGADGVTAVSDEENFITITTDKDNKTLTITDSGVNPTPEPLYPKLHRSL